MWASAYSALASRPALGRYQVASTTRTSGLPRWAASQSVPTSGSAAMHAPSRSGQPGGDGQPLPAQELGVEELGLVAGAVVAQDRHDRVARAQLPGDLDRP